MKHKRPVVTQNSGVAPRTRNVKSLKGRWKSNHLLIREAEWDVTASKEESKRRRQQQKNGKNREREREKEIGIDFERKKGEEQFSAVRPGRNGNQREPRIPTTATIQLVMMPSGITTHRHTHRSFGVRRRRREWKMRFWREQSLASLFVCECVESGVTSAMIFQPLRSDRKWIRVRRVTWDRLPMEWADWLLYKQSRSCRHSDSIVKHLG